MLKTFEHIKAGARRSQEHYIALVRRREEFGFSYIVFSGGSWEAMAPVVARLAGT